MKKTAIALVALAAALFAVSCQKETTPEQRSGSEQNVLSGEFTVNADGKQVHFSQGNLWYGKVGGATEATWNFETNQYDVQSSWNTSHVSHFFWSKDASVTYAESYSDSGAADSDVFFTNDPADSEKVRTDFTVNGVTGKYRTLSTAEWQYLFSYDGTQDGKYPEKTDYSNETRNGKYKCGVNVCGKANCVVLLPDNWDEGVISLTNFASTSAYNDSSSPTWQTMQEAGAVCLPAVGSRDDSNVSHVDEGYYWSSSNFYDLACYMNFEDEKVILDNRDSRGYGYSVRLVTDVK